MLPPFRSKDQAKSFCGSRFDLKLLERAEATGLQLSSRARKEQSCRAGTPLVSLLDRVEAPVSVVIHLALFVVTENGDLGRAVQQQVGVLRDCSAFSRATPWSRTAVSGHGVIRGSCQLPEPLVFQNNHSRNGDRAGGGGSVYRYGDPHMPLLPITSTSEFLRSAPTTASPGLITLPTQVCVWVCTCISVCLCVCEATTGKRAKNRRVDGGRTEVRERVYFPFRGAGF